MPRQTWFWSVDDRLRVLSEQSDPLVKILEIVDFELFRPVLAEAIGPSDRPKGGRPPFGDWDVHVAHTGAAFNLRRCRLVIDLVVGLQLEGVLPLPRQNATLLVLRDGRVQVESTSSGSWTIQLPSAALSCASITVASSTRSKTSATPSATHRPLQRRRADREERPPQPASLAPQVE